ncbi:TLDc domain-containing protein, partial [Panaeolus papilionaceus]
LPALFRLPKAWSLIYSLDQHGISLNTLYTLSEKHYSRPPKPGELGNTGMLLVIKDSGDTVFGAWLGEGIRTRHLKGNSHFGGGESFLWKYSNSRLQIFRCTGKNNYTALVEPQYISFGGGDGHYGLYLDESLFEGSSAPCPTFQNDPLCSPGEKKGSSVVFECVGLEVWAMV